MLLTVDVVARALGPWGEISVQDVGAAIAAFEVWSASGLRLIGRGLGDAIKDSGGLGKHI